MNLYWIFNLVSRLLPHLNRSTLLPMANSTTILSTLSEALNSTTLEQVTEEEDEWRGWQYVAGVELCLICLIALCMLVGVIAFYRKRSRRVYT
jgi:heme/copper-type cytochrome/quinol oxidase subunit 2